MCGVTTHIVTAVEIKDKDASDTRQLPELLRKTKINFDVQELMADKAYGSLDNYEKCVELGVTPFIAFKTSHNGAAKGKYSEEAKKLWRKMLWMFQFHEEEFLSHYHQRSNVETVFSMIKAKFDGRVRGKSETAALNEVLCKIVCHNICCVIAASFKFQGVDLERLFSSSTATLEMEAVRHQIAPISERPPSCGPPP